MHLCSHSRGYAYTVFAARVFIYHWFNFLQTFMHSLVHLVCFVLLHIIIVECRLVYFILRYVIYVCVGLSVCPCVRSCLCLRIQVLS